MVASKHKKQQRGRELNVKTSPPKHLPELEVARLSDWNTWLSRDAVDSEVDRDMYLTNLIAVQMRSVVTGKNENIRGDKSVEEVSYQL